MADYYTVKASVGSVAFAAVFLSNPDYYLFAPISVPILVLAYFSLKKKSSKALLVVCFVAISLYSFLIGRYFIDNHRLTDSGLFAMLIAIGIVFLLAIALFANEKETT